MRNYFEHKKSLGQHFLKSDVVPTWMCDAARVTSGDTVIEIGPGTGVLTRALLARGAHVIAIETDRRAITVLEETFRDELTSGHLTIHNSDARQLSLESYGLADHAFKIVANIPYYLSGHLFRSCLEHPIQPSDLVFLVQKEVAKRGAAPLPPKPKAKGSLLGLSLQVYGDVSIYKAVSRGHFTPPPSVDSAIISVRNISRTFFTDLNEQLFFEVVRTGFGNKRKQLQHNLTKQYGQEVVANVFEIEKIPDTIRAEDVSLSTWKDIVLVIQKQLG